VAALGFAGSVDKYLTAESANLVTTESDTGFGLSDEIRADASSEGVFSETIIVSSEAAHFGEPAFDTALSEVLATAGAIEGVTSVDAPTLGSPLVSDSGFAALISVTTVDDTAVIESLVASIDALEVEGFDLIVTGEESSLLAFSELANSEMARGESFGLVAALIILVVVFGAFAAAGLPLGVALVSVLTTTGVISLLGRIDTIYDGALTLSGMLGLALGIDYSLVSVQRFREELAKGHTVSDAVTITGSTANRAVLLSGTTVVISIGGMFLIPTNTTYGVAIGVGLVALVSVCAALTLLPAVLRLLGHRVNKGRVPTSHPGVQSVGWTRIARVVIAKPAVSVAIGLGVLLTLAAPIASMRVANSGPDSLPEDFVVRRANTIMVEEFGWGQQDTFVAITGADTARLEIDALAAAIEGDEAWAGTTVDHHGAVAFIDTHDVFESDDSRSDDAVERLRSEIIPAALGGTGAAAYVAGDHAKATDEIALFADNGWKVFAAVLGASFILLTIMFRSIVVPLKAIILNLLGVGAAFGSLVAAYQYGWGTAIGLPAVDGISPYMPVFIFALVFGLSMDYHVFLLSRIKERYDGTGNNRLAVIEGVARTGPLITGAAIIMVAVFGGFAGASIPEMSQWGFGLGFAVLIDATIIRVLLVPAAMAWLGDANWYLPSWLQWLPTMHIEGGAAPALVEEEVREREPALV
jgi:RND superfamily putative drug exporter